MGGTGGYLWSLANGSLPAGLSSLPLDESAARERQPDHRPLLRSEDNGRYRNPANSQSESAAPQLTRSNPALAAQLARRDPVEPERICQRRGGWLLAVCLVGIIACGSEPVQRGGYSRQSNCSGTRNIYCAVKDSSVQPRQRSRLTINYCGLQLHDHYWLRGRMEQEARNSQTLLRSGRDSADIYGLVLVGIIARADLADRRSSVGTPTQCVY